MSKNIDNYFDLKKVCRTAGLWYVGSFMLEYIKRADEWKDQDRKQKFIEYMHDEYVGIDKDYNGTKTRVNAMIRIIESGRVEEALERVLESDRVDKECPESKHNAKYTLELLESGKLTY